MSSLSAPIVIDPSDTSRRSVPSRVRTRSIMLVLSRGCVGVVRRLDARLFSFPVREGGELGFTYVKKL